MPKMIQLRHVPDDLHRKLKARAATVGMSLSDFLIAELKRAAEQPTLEEVYERLQRLPPVVVREPPAKVIRAERDRR